MGKTNSKDKKRRNQTAKKFERKKDEEFEKTGAKSVLRNDPAWYGINGEMFVSAGNISFNNALGSAYELDWDDDATVIPNKVSMPGIMTLWMNPSIGVSSTTASDINVAARQLYSEIRHRNSGSSTYDPSDYMLYYLAMGEAYSLYTYMVRIYGTLRLYSQLNRYIPETLLNAQGIDFADFQVNQADFYWYLTQYANKLNRFAIPAGLPYFNRKLYIYSGIYVDDNSPKHQYYLHAPAGFWKYNELDGAGKLEYAEWNDPTTPSLKTYSQLTTYADDMIRRLAQSQDIATNMSGDTIKAFGNNLIKAAVPTPEYTTLPVYDQYALLQIHNTTVFWWNDLDNSTFDVTQDAGINGYLLHQPALSDNMESYNRAYGGRRILDMMQYSGTPADVMEATRDMVIVDTDTQQFTTCGADYCVGMTYYKFQDVGGTWSAVANYNLGHIRTLDLSSYTDCAMAFASLSDVTRFDWHPYISIATPDDDANLRYMGTFGDIGNFTTIGEYELSKLNTTAMLSLFSVPKAPV